MIIQPRMRGFICLTAHPEGCEQNVKNQIAYVKEKGNVDGPKKVLVIGASTGFGLSSRIVSAFGSNAATLGVFFEKAPEAGKTATPGWYNSAAFEKLAQAEGLYAKSINGDAFSDEIKQQVIDTIKADLGQVDLVIYSLASPVRTNPRDGVTYRSVLKPIGQVFSNKTVDFHSGKVSEVSINPAEGDDIANTVAVMGGEDWKFWMEALRDAGVLAEGVQTVAYSYIGPELTEAVYRKGTIGQAKDDLEAKAAVITNDLASLNGKAFVSVNKALVTQASSAIPVIPLYMSLLFKVMKEAGTHEGTIEQMYRLFNERLFTAEGNIPVDQQGRIRIDDWEMEPAIQSKVKELWAQATTENLAEIGDLETYRQEFHKLFGFNYPEIDYQAETNELVQIPSIQ